MDTQSTSNRGSKHTQTHAHTHTDLLCKRVQNRVCRSQTPTLVQDHISGCFKGSCTASHAYTTYRACTCIIALLCFCCHFSQIAAGAAHHHSTSWAASASRGQMLRRSVIVCVRVCARNCMCLGGVMSRSTLCLHVCVCVCVCVCV